MNIEYYKEYIQDSVIHPLERLMGNDVEEVSVYEKYYHREGFPPKDAIYRSLLHEMMLPYYKMYLNGDTRICCVGTKLESIRYKMEHAIEDDNQFGLWASEQDLIVAAEGWGDNLNRFEKEEKRIYRFFHLLEMLFRSGCEQDWVNLSEKLKEMLFKAEMCYNYKTDEVLCILHAFTMIMQQEWTLEKKREQLALLNNQWKFLKHYYSVMIRHIIGVRWTSFKKVAETVLKASQSFRPHMHIFYCGLIDCVDELHLDRRHQREMDKVIMLMGEELNRIKDHSEVLYELCDALFPEDFQRMLRENRPKSYKEMEDESNRKDELIAEMEHQAKLLHKQLDRAEDMLQKMVLSSIPIEDVDKELMKYPPGVAWDFLLKLNANPIICMQEAWRENYPSLLEKYRKRLYEPIDQQRDLTDAIMKVAERPTTSYNYASGATHDDKRSQLVLGQEDKIVQLKRLTNE